MIKQLAARDLARCARRNSERFLTIERHKYRRAEAREATKRSI
ncbi:hypothetical protein [Caballeronia terrestris]|nr:hypothetical protein [Caballeronia terrestris]